MTGDSKQKECKHCMTLISRRASVCPQCRNSVARFSGLVSFVRSGAWFVTATVSLGFAAVEKWEKLGLSKELGVAKNEITQKENVITQKEIETDVLREQVFERPRAAMMRYTPNDPSPSGVAPSDDVIKEEYAEAEKEIREIKGKFTELLKAREEPDREALKELEREKLQQEIKLRKLRESFPHLR